MKKEREEIVVGIQLLMPKTLNYALKQSFFACRQTSEVGSMCNACANDGHLITHLIQLKIISKYNIPKQHLIVHTQ